MPNELYKFLFSREDEDGEAILTRDGEYLQIREPQDPLCGEAIGAFVGAKKTMRQLKDEYDIAMLIDLASIFAYDESN